MIYLIDCFCGAGGTTTSAHMAGKGIKVIMAINHDELAIESHKANYPDCMHETEDILTVDLTEISMVARQIKFQDPTAIIALWQSLECTNFSNAKGGKPKDADSRALAENIFRYIDQIDPDVILIENVREFMEWGPLDKDNKPIKHKKGVDYINWIQQIQKCGYHFDFRILNSADFGGYTIRKRYFGMFAKDQRLVNFPDATHCKFGKEGLPWKMSKDVLDLESYGESIFERKKPLVENTLKRIYEGLLRYHKEGYFVQKYYTDKKPGNQTISVNQPLGTVTTIDHHSFVRIHALQSYYGNGSFFGVRQPCGTVTTKDRFSKIDFIYNPQWGGSMKTTDKPFYTVIARMDKAPFYKITLLKSNKNAVVKKGDSETMVKIKNLMKEIGVSDITTRMLFIHELLKIQGFPEDYKLCGKNQHKKKFIGNSVEINVGIAIFKNLIKNHKEVLNDSSRAN